MPNIQVLLREDVDHLGVRGAVVRVKAGYARNYLLPRKLAVEANAGNVRQIEAEKAALAKREERDKAEAGGQASKLQELQLRFERRVGEHGILYGSVTSMDIAEALKEQGFEVDRRRIMLRDPIKEVGDFTVQLKLHREVSVDLTVNVVAAGSSSSETMPPPDAGTSEETSKSATDKQ